MQPSPSCRRPWPAVVCLAGLVLALSSAPGFAAKEPKKRVAVTAFENKAGYVHHEWGDLGAAMAEKLVQALMDTGKFVVLERQALEDVLAEQNLDKVAPVSPGEEARLITAQALIRGVITSLEVLGGGQKGVRLGGIGFGSKKQSLVVEVNLRMIDTSTSLIISSATVKGVAELKGLSVQGDLGGLGGDFGKETRIPVGQAVDDAVAKAVGEIVAGMERIPWQGAIVRVSGGQIFVNAGLQENVEPGLRLTVLEKGAELIDTETYVNLGSLDEEIGVIEIERVAPRFSVARVVEGRGFAPGNIVRPAPGTP